MFENVSFTLGSGEILGFGGFVGSGRTEVARVLFGIDQPTAGRILLNGKQVSFATAEDAMNVGIAYASGDRMGQSFVMDFFHPGQCRSGRDRPGGPFRFRGTRA